MKQISGFLNIRYPGLPKQIDEVNLLYANVTESVELSAVPKDSINAGAALQLVVPHLIVCLLKIILIEDNR